MTCKPNLFTPTHYVCTSLSAMAREVAEKGQNPDGTKSTRVGKIRTILGEEALLHLSTFLNQRATGRDARRWWGSTIVVPGGKVFVTGTGILVVILADPISITAVGRGDVTEVTWAVEHRRMQFTLKTKKTGANFYNFLLPKTCQNYGECFSLLRIFRNDAFFNNKRNITVYFVLFASFFK